MSMHTWCNLLMFRGRTAHQFSVSNWLTGSGTPQLFLPVELFTYWQINAHPIKFKVCACDLLTVKKMFAVNLCKKQALRN